MISKVRKFIEKHRIIEPNSTIVVGLSGGPDSVCLLHVLRQLQEEYGLVLIAAHLDHEWRNNSKEDARFCKQYAESLGIHFVEAKASEIVGVRKYNGSKEELGRRLRRSFFESVMQKNNGHSIALGHHANDQQETFFLRMMRGASIAGLSGMKPKERGYLRPLLGCHKHEILEYSGRTRARVCN